MKLQDIEQQYDVWVNNLYARYSWLYGIVLSLAVVCVAVVVVTVSLWDAR